VLDRCGGVDDNAVLRDVVFRLMPSHDEFAFSRLSATPLVVRSLVKPPMQRGKVDFKDKDAVEQIDKFREVPGATAKECDRFIPVGDQGSNSVYVPDVVLVSETIPRFTGFGIAPVSQLAIAMNGVVAAPLQFVANGGLAGAGKALDQVIPPAHVLENTHHEGQHGLTECWCVVPPDGVVDAAQVTHNDWVVVMVVRDGGSRSACFGRNLTVAQAALED
jgi:hypothetical protein